MFKMIFKKYYVILITISFIISLGISLTTGLSSSYLTLDNNFTKYKNDYNYQGSEIIFDSNYLDLLNNVDIDIDIDSIINDIDIDLRHITNYELRLFYKTIITHNSNVYFTNIYTYDLDSYNLLYYVEKSSNIYNNEVYLEYNFALNNNINIDDDITINLGNNSYIFKVSKLVSSPETFGSTNEYNLSLEERNYIYIPTSSFLYVTNSKLDNFSNDVSIRNVYNNASNLYDLVNSNDLGRPYISLLLFYDTFYENSIIHNIKNDFNKSMIKFIGNESLISKLSMYEDYIYNIKINTYYNSGFKSRVDANLETINIILNFVPIVFFIVVMITVSLFMTLLINYSKKEIGILMSLGYSNKKICINYIKVFICTFIIGALLGLLMSNILNVYVSDKFTYFFPIPSYGYIFDTNKYLISTFISFILSFISLFISLSFVRKINPIEAMNRFIYKEFKISLITDKFTSIFKPVTKFNILILLRNKLSLILSIICIIFSICIVYSSFSFYTSKNHLLVDLFIDRLKYDVVITSSSGISNELINSITNLSTFSSYDIAKVYNTSIVNLDNKKDITIVGINNSDFINIYDKNNNKLKVPYGSIIMEYHDMNDLKLNVNDYVTINNKDILISNVSYESTNQFNYVDITYFDELFNSDYELLMINIDSTDYNNLRNIVFNDEDLSISFMNEVYSNSKKQLDEFNIPIYLIILFSVLITLLIIVNTLTLHIIEQKRKISIMLSLGFSTSDIANDSFICSLCYFIISIIPGLILGYYITILTLNKFSIGSRYYEFINSDINIIITLLILTIFILIGHYISMKKINKWSIVENIKERD